MILTEKLPRADRKKLEHTADAVIELGADLVRRIIEIERENRQLRSLSLTDELTGLYNKRFFKMQLGVEMARSKRTGQPCCMAILDFDNFKEINDSLGHSEGDRFLKEVGLLMRDRLRPTDFICRLGGTSSAFSCRPRVSSMPSVSPEGFSNSSWISTGRNSSPRRASAWQSSTPPKKRH